LFGQSIGSGPWTPFEAEKLLFLGPASGVTMGWNSAHINAADSATIVT
jgi:hypothetical protein